MVFKFLCPGSGKIRSWMPNAPGFPASYKNVGSVNACEHFDLPTMVENIYRGDSHHPALDRKEQETGRKGRRVN
jgi:hypothetical protein